MPHYHHWSAPLYSLWFLGFDSSIHSSVYPIFPYLSLTGNHSNMTCCLCMNFYLCMSFENVCCCLVNTYFKILYKWYAVTHCIKLYDTISHYCFQYLPMFLCVHPLCYFQLCHIFCDVYLSHLMDCTLGDGHSQVSALPIIINIAVLILRGISVIVHLGVGFLGHKEQMDLITPCIARWFCKVSCTTLPQAEHKIFTIILSGIQRSDGQKVIGQGCFNFHFS